MGISVTSELLADGEGEGPSFCSCPWAHIQMGFLTLLLWFFPICPCDPQWLSSSSWLTLQGLAKWIFLTFHKMLMWFTLALWQFSISSWLICSGHKLSYICCLILQFPHAKSLIMQISLLLWASFEIIPPRSTIPFHVEWNVKVRVLSWQEALKWPQSQRGLYIDVFICSRLWPRQGPWPRYASLTYISNMACVFDHKRERYNRRFGWLPANPSPLLKVIQNTSPADSWSLVSTLENHSVTLEN